MSPLGCICLVLNRGYIDFHKEYLAQSVYSKTIIIMSLHIIEEGCKHTPCYIEYVHANVTETLKTMMVMYNVIGARGRGVKT